MMISAAMPHCSSGKRTENRKRIGCQVNMKQIVLALQVYADNNRDHYPDKLEMLFPEYIREKADLHCPSAKGNHGFSDYNYYGKGRKSAARTFLILEDRIENHRDNYKNQAESDGYCTFTKKIR